MKEDVGYAIQVEVTKPVNVQIGIVGKQPGDASGGNQLHFNMPPDKRNKVFKIIDATRIH